MTELRLKSSQFRQERQADWRRLDSLLTRIERGSAARLSPDELLEVPVLYRAALSSLSMARSISLDQDLIGYLEQLCTRAYFVVYGVRAGLGERIQRFFAHDWPAAVRSLWKETLIAALLLFGAAAAAFGLVTADPDWFSTFVPEGASSGRDPSASTAMLRDTLYGGETQGLSVFATFLFTHNSQVAIFAFALGFALCIPTAALMAFNGAMLGAMLALFASRGLGLELTGWLMVHGTTELFAVVLAGAAGISIGWAVAFPGELSRMEAGSRAGRRAGVVMAGVVIMLLVAGVLEGFARQLIQVDLVRYGVGGGMLLLWLAYFHLPKRPR